jgi:molybdopterin-guanine dinucleotide biosynthesis protein A
MTDRAALILAGGKARRFQSKGADWQDKALANLDGKPLLVHSIENVLGVVDQVVVCVNDEQRKEQYLKVLADFAAVNIKVVVDMVGHTKGPNLAIMSGLKAVSEDYCLTLPCDMPFLKPQVAEYMFKVAEGVDVAVPMWPDGMLETLLMVLERKNGLEITQTLWSLNLPRGDAIIRGASKRLLVSPMQEIKALDPELKSFININSKKELTNLETRSTVGEIKENVSLTTGTLSFSDLRLLQEGQRRYDEGGFLEAEKVFLQCTANFEAKKIYFWAGVSGKKLGDLAMNQSASKAKEAYLRAANDFQAEAELYLAKGCKALAARASIDKIWCHSQIP